MPIGASSNASRKLASLTASAASISWRSSSASRRSVMSRARLSTSFAPSGPSSGSAENS